jgi:hypothetical protein
MKGLGINMKISQFSLSFALLFLFGCGYSPLMNHSNADDLPARAIESLDANCPLAFPKSGFCAALTWNVGPSEEESSFTLKFWKRVGGPQLLVDPPHSVAVQLWMPDMGHGSSAVTVTKVADGVFSATRVSFIMPGDWDIRIQLKDAAKVIEQTVVKETIR